MQVETERMILIVRYGEIALKKRNQRFFKNKLINNLKARLSSIANIEVIEEHGRVFIEYDKSNESEVIEKTIKIFGVVSVSPAVKIENDIELIKEYAVKMVRENIESGKECRFKVESRRANKGFEFKSPEISKIVGGYLHDEIDELVVDVNTPELIVSVEVRNQTYIYSEVISGYSGMPYGCAGRGVLLLSGGIDSPVAGWMMAKRGLELEAVHFHSAPFTSKRAEEKVFDLARILSDYTGEIIVHSVNLLEIQRAIQEKCPSSQMTILSRRFMMMIAQKIARENKCQALVTGESMGQVASQTLEGLTVTNNAVDIPVFRPLIGMDKLDIVKIAQRIGTYETSILPFEDCCTVFLPEKVMTRPSVNVILESEQLLDKQNLIDNAVENREIHKFEFKK